MKLFAPKYYKSFTCKMDKCGRNCCVGWEIYIDEKTAEKYRTEKGTLWDSVRKGLVENPDGTASFRMECGRCPNLTDEGLCRIIAEAGEGMLSEICREHPRFYNRTVYGEEVGLGLACEAAAELILENDLKIECIGSRPDMSAPSGINICEDRERALAILHDNSLTYNEKIAVINRMLGIEKTDKSFTSWMDFYLELENLDPLWRVYLNAVKNSKNDFVMPHGEDSERLSRVIAYFLYRYMPISEDSDHERAIVAFSLHSALMIYTVYSANKDRISLIDACVLFSSEIEYSEENVEKLISEFDTSFDF